MTRSGRIAAWILAAILTLVIGFVSLTGFIRWTARQDADRAVARYGGDRIAALTAAVDCPECPLRARDRAVWDLGELRDARALPVLKAHYTGQKCNHEVDLCQYELGKAIMKIEGTWNRRSVAQLFGRK